MLSESLQHFVYDFIYLTAYGIDKLFIRIDENQTDFFLIVPVICVPDLIHNTSESIVLTCHAHNTVHKNGWRLFRGTYGLM